MDAWQVALISTIVPACLTVGVPYVSKQLDRRRRKILSNAEVAQALRDELRLDNQVLRKRIDVLEAENQTLRMRVTRLEDEIRRRGHHDIIEEIG